MVARPFEFLLTFLLRAPPLEMRRECQGSIPDEAGKGTFISSRGEGHGAPLEFDRTLGVRLKWRQVCQGIS